MRQDVNERAAAHVLHAAVLGQKRHAEPGERGGAQHPEVIATESYVSSIPTPKIARRFEAHHVGRSDCGTRPADIGAKIGGRLQFTNHRWLQHTA
jgi:hypothetical protein